MARIGARLWRLFGGRLDEGGNPDWDPDDRVDIFQGVEVDALDVAEVLSHSGVAVETRPQATVGLAGQPWVYLTVRAADLRGAYEALSTDSRWGRLYRESMIEDDR